ncbi:hypothetical protein PG990_011671 [Apiospora arundinis]
MAAQSSTPAPQQPLAPEILTFSCGHTRTPGRLLPQEREIVESMVVHDLLPLKDNDAPLMIQCSQCIQEMQKECRRSDPGYWLNMHEELLRGEGVARKDYASLALMFRHIWTMLTDERELDNLLHSRDVPAFVAFRVWCKSVAQRLNTEPDPTALTRFLATIQDVHGYLVCQEVNYVVEHYQRQPKPPQWNMERVWPVTARGRDANFFTEVDRFRTVALRIQAYIGMNPNRLFNNVLLSASHWSGELLGPPQESDLRLKELQLEVSKSQSMNQIKVDLLVALIKMVNLETMRFKTQLYQMYRRSDEAMDVQDSDQMRSLMDLVEALQMRGNDLALFHDRLRRSWDEWVEFAKPFAHLLKDGNTS